MKTFVYELFPRSIARRKLALFVFSEMDRVDVNQQYSRPHVRSVKSLSHTSFSFPSIRTYVHPFNSISSFLSFDSYFISSFCIFFIRRVWRVLTLVAPSYRTADGQPLNPVTDIYASDYPFSVKPDVPLTPADLMRIQV